ncbi:Alpha-glucosidase [Arthrobotrys entomopaga]|nr:Alpha-glucosidase [Arthrobotrys entomopaga]
MDTYSFENEPIAQTDAIVGGDNYRFSVLTDRLIRYEWAFDGKFEDRASTFAINRRFPVPDYRVVEGKSEIEIITQFFHLTYDKGRFTQNGFSVILAGKDTAWGTTWHYGTSDSGNLGGTTRTLDEVDGRCAVETGILSKNGIASIDDSNSILFGTNGFMDPRPAGHRVDGYLFCYGRDYKAAIKALYNISGKQPPLPRWALGNWWSRYYAYSDVEYIGLIDKFSEQKVPLAVAVLDMDWHLVHDDRVPHSGWTGYTWNKNLFPDPAKFGKEIHGRNLRITLNDHPHGGIHHHEDAYESMAKAIGHDTTHKAPILFDATNKAFLDAFFGVVHRPIEKEACDFWWIDWQQGSHSKVEGMDPLWLLNHFQYLDTAKTSKKPLIFSRYAGPGSHRYPVGFSGDTVTSWNSLAFQPEFTATASNIGYGWWSHDIGGHFHGYRNDELVTRWVQFGVFSPIMRLHSSNSYWSSKEPWKYQREYQDVMIHYLRLRHRLIPYIYSINVGDSDLPIIQPMYWTHPSRPEAYTVPNQYYFGSQAFVVPLVTPRNRSTGLAMAKAWIPPGRHVDIFTGIIYDGDRTVNIYRHLAEYPLFCAEGAVLPLDISTQPQNGALNPNGFEIIVVVGQDGRFEIFEDEVDLDSHSVLMRNGTSGGGQAYSRSIMEWSQASGTLLAFVSRKSSCCFRFIGICRVPENLRVSVNGSIGTDFSAEAHQYPKVPCVTVTLHNLPLRTANIVLQLGPNMQLEKYDHTARLQNMCLNYQTDFDQKDVIWDIVKNGQQPINVRVGSLLALGLDEAIIGPFLEVMLADSRAFPPQSQKGKRKRSE